MLSSTNSLRLSGMAANNHYWEDNAIINNYFAKARQSNAEKEIDLEILGEAAIEAAKRGNRYSDLSQIYASLASTVFLKSKYLKVIEYVDLCHECKLFLDKRLLINCYYLKSTSLIRLAEKEPSPSSQHSFFQKAQITAQEALTLFDKTQITDFILQGNILFNLGAVEEEISEGSLHKAIEFYQQALVLFKRAEAKQESIDTTSRLMQIRFKLLKTSDSIKKNFESIKALNPQI